MAVAGLERQRPWEAINSNASFISGPSFASSFSDRERRVGRYVADRVNRPDGRRELFRGWRSRNSSPFAYYSSN